MNLFKKNFIYLFLSFLNIFSENFKLKKYLNSVKKIILNNKKTSVGISAGLIALISGISLKKYLEKNSNFNIKNNKQDNKTLLNIKNKNSLNNIKKYEEEILKETKDSKNNIKIINIINNYLLKMSKYEENSINKDLIKELTQKIEDNLSNVNNLDSWNEELKKIKKELEKNKNIELNELNEKINKNIEIYNNYFDFKKEQKFEDFKDKNIKNLDDIKDLKNKFSDHFNKYIIKNVSLKEQETILFRNDINEKKIILENFKIDIFFKEINKNLNNLNIQKIKENFKNNEIISINNMNFCFNVGIYNKKIEGNIGDHLIEKINKFLDEKEKQIEIENEKIKNKDLDKQKENIKNIIENRKQKKQEKELKKKEEQLQKRKEMEDAINHFKEEYKKSEDKSKTFNIDFAKKIKKFIDENKDFVDTEGNLILDLKILFENIKNNLKTIEDFKRNFDILIETNLKNAEDLFINFKKNNKNFLSEDEKKEFQKKINSFKTKKNDINLLIEGYLNKLKIKLIEENQDLEFFKIKNKKYQIEIKKDESKEVSFLNSFFETWDSFSSYVIEKKNEYFAEEQKQQNEQNLNSSEIKDDFEIIISKNTKIIDIIDEFEKKLKKVNNGNFFIILKSFYLDVNNLEDIKNIKDENFNLLSDNEKKLIKEFIKIKILKVFEKLFVNFKNDVIENRSENFNNIKELIKKYELIDVKEYIEEKIAKEKEFFEIENKINEEIKELKNSGIKNQSGIKNNFQIKNQKQEEDQQNKNVQLKTIEQKMKNFSDKVFVETGINIYEIYTKLINLTKKNDFINKFERAKKQNEFFKELDEIIKNAGIQKDGHSADKLKNYFKFLANFNNDKKNNQNNNWLKNHKVVFKKIDLEKDKKIIFTTDVHSSLMSLIDCLRSFINGEVEGLIISGDYVHRDIHNDGTQSMLCLLLSSFMSVFGEKEKLNILLTRGNHETGDCGNPPPENKVYYSSDLLRENNNNYLKKIFPMQGLIFVNNEDENDLKKENLFVVQHSIGASRKIEKFDLNEIKEELNKKTTIIKNVNLIENEIDESFFNQGIVPELWCDISKNDSKMVKSGPGSRGAFSLEKLNEILNSNYKNLPDNYKTMTGHQHGVETFKQIDECCKGRLIGFKDGSFEVFENNQFDGNKNMFNMFHYDNNQYGKYLSGNLNKNIKQVVSVFKDGNMKSNFISENGLEEIEQKN